jgi:hypothetical protein
MDFSLAAWGSMTSIMNEAEHAQASVIEAEHNATKRNQAQFCRCDMLKSADQVECMLRADQTSKINVVTANDKRDHADSSSAVVQLLMAKR